MQHSSYFSYFVVLVVLCGICQARRNKEGDKIIIGDFGGGGGGGGGGSRISKFRLF